MSAPARIGGSVGVVAALLFAPVAVAASSPASKDADREALRRALSEVLGRAPLKDARVSVLVQSLDEGKAVFAHHPDDLLNPASNVKLFTAAAALARLGPEFRFETEFFTDVEPVDSDGKVRALYVRGKGDPSITTERLHGIVGELLHAGLREVNGDIIVDETYFDGERIAPGYEQEQSDRSYMAPNSAVSLNWNAVGIFLRPGRGTGSRAEVLVEPKSDYFTVDGSLTTGTRYQRRFSVSSRLDRDGQHQRIEVRGSIPNQRGVWSVWKKIDEPPYYFGYTLKELLAQRGVRVRGKVRLGPVPNGAKVLHVAQSDTLDLVLKRLNKFSSNFVAEQLVKTLGAEGKGVPGSHAKGVEVVEEFLAREVGIPRGSYVMKNGSGLNDTNRFSATQITKLLGYMQKRLTMEPEFLSALGIAGKDGTLRYRFEGSDAVGRLRAKTGTLSNVSALSGYVESVGGERFAFSIIVNDFSGRVREVVQHIDALGAAVAAAGSTQGPNAAVVSLTPPAPTVTPLEVLKTRAGPFAALGRQADARNIPFLRTAWRTERDPALRALIAEALYQSNPQEASNTRALLDSFLASDEVYGRLRALARKQKTEVPGVGSLVELAAGGNLEAMGRLFELCRAASGDELSRGELGAVLVEVTRSAPDELVVALRLASAPERDAAVALLAQGLVKDQAPDHPLWPALRKAMGAPDPQLAAIARATESALSVRIAEQRAPPAPAPAPPAVKVKPADTAPALPGG